VLAAIAGTVLFYPLASQQPASGQTAVHGPAPLQIGAGTVADIRIEGAERIEPETIRS